MILPLTCLYAVIFAILMIILGARVSILRAKLDVALSHNGDPRLAERIRQYGNFIENVPMAIIVMALVEANGASIVWLHAMGVLLLIGRIMHPFGIRINQSKNFPRIAGMILTRGSLMIGLVFLIMTGV